MTDPLIGKQLGDYRIIDILGRGGMAHVYRGFDSKLQRYAALKVIDANRTGNETEEEYRQRFQREARAIAHLNHPNIVGVYQFGEEGSLYYMAMAFIEGRDLSQILKEHSAGGTLMPHAQVLQIIRDIGGALDHAHSQGVIHRDIKPSNIMVTHDGHAVLTDFGLALSVPEGSIGNTFGSAHYIAPEQAISSAQAVPQSDLYALGVVLYQMLTGKVPFDDKSAMSVALKHLSDPPPPIREYNPRLSAAVERVVNRALEKEPGKRFKSGATMAQAFDSALRDESFLSRFSRPSKPARAAVQADDVGSAPTSPSIAERERLQAPPKRRRRLLSAVVALLALALVGAGVWLLYPFITGAPARDESTPVADALETGEASATPAPTATPTPTTLPSATPMPTDQPTFAPPSPSPLPGVSGENPLPGAADAPTGSPEPSATSVPEVRETATFAPDASYVRLVYDADEFVLFNDAQVAADVGGLVFVLIAPNGEEIRLAAYQWASAGATLHALPPKDCFQLWTLGFSQMVKPDYCEARQAWRAVGAPRWFWISTEPDMTFQVRRGDAVLAVCSVDGGECVVDLAGAS